MFYSLWRRLRNQNPGPSRGGSLQGGRHPSYRPRLESLEDRVLPAVAAAGVFAPAVGPSAVSGSQQTGIKLSGATRPIAVTVAENSSPTVIDLGPVFAAMSSIHAEDGLRLSVLSNTNSGLVRTDLSEAALTLTYVPGRWGTATIIVGGTDADGVSAQQTILVTVCPPSLVGTLSVLLTPVGTPVSTAPGLPR